MLFSAYTDPVCEVCGGVIDDSVFDYTGRCSYCLDGGKL